MRRNFRKNAFFFFTFRSKQCFYLTHSAQEYFKKMKFKKTKKKRNFKRLYLTSTEKSFNFLQKKLLLHAPITWVHCRALRLQQPPMLLLGTRWTERVNDEKVKVLNLLFLASFIMK